MLTEATKVTEAGPTLLTISQIAERHGMSRQAVSRRVSRLAERHEGFQVRRDVEGRVVGVPVAEYEVLIGRFGDSAKRPIPQRQPRLDEGGGAAEQSLDQARLLTAQVNAERAAIQLRRDKGELVRRERIEAALEEAGLEVAGIVDRLPRYADELSVAVGQDGVQGLRVALKKLARDMRNDIASTLERLHDDAPDLEEDAVEEEAAG